MKLKSVVRHVVLPAVLSLLGFTFTSVAQTPPLQNRPPEVRLVHPPNGAVFVAPPEILVIASAHDPDGRVVSVEFFADGVSLGVAEPPPSPGMPALDDSHPEWGPIHPYWVRWQDPPPGGHVLTAVATDNAGAKGTSLPVEIKVVECPLPPVVSVLASDPEGSEGKNDPAGVSAPDPAKFLIRRTGPTDFPLAVFFKLEGTAENGIDYSELPLQATIPIGERSVEVVVKPIDDTLVEGPESVVLILQPPNCLDVYPPGKECYVVGRPAVARAVIYDNDVPPNQPPLVEMVHPHDGEVFLAPANIALVAAAWDLDGTVAKVEFFEGDTSLGVARLMANTPPRYALLWSNVVAGEYTLTAVATDNQGASKTSKPVEIKVVKVQVPPVVTVEATDPEAAEPGPDATAASINTATFLIKRTGSTEAPLTVWFTLGGSAQNGIDYARVPNLTTIPAGAVSKQVVITPLDDNLVEGAESVVLTLVPPRCITPLPVLPPEPIDGWYIVGTPGAARAVILDNDTQGNLLPKIEIVRPQNGQMFLAPADIKIEAVARDPDGWVPLVEFYAGDTLIGKQEIMFIVEPPPGQAQLFGMTWTGVAPGAYVLRAKATDNLGASSWSGPVGILVVRPDAPPVVTIFAADPVASEPGILTVIDTATFVVHRTGSLVNPLTVLYKIGGTALNGIDYRELSGRVTINEGQEAARIIVDPLFDTLVEGTETVVVELVPRDCTATDPSPANCYRVGDFKCAMAKILDRPGPGNLPPKAEIVRPQSGEVFQAPADVKIVVAAVDPDGWVTKVEFFADGVKIGEQLAPDPTNTTPTDERQVFAMGWINAPVGRHVLTAKAHDNRGAWSFTPPVTIVVVEHQLPPLVNIVATDPFAAERPADARPNTATFRIRRTGNTNEPLTVFYSIHGSAENGVDYETIGTTVTIPAGRRSARVVITPIDDNVPERLETVVLRLVPSPTMGPIDPYRIGWPARAGAVIADNDQPEPMVRSLSEGSFHVCLEGEDGMPYRFEASDDLVNWFPVGEGIASGGRVHYVEPGLAEAPHRFYRVRPIVAEAIDLDD